MDPATASSLAIGVTSLVFDVFDNSVKRQFVYFFFFLSSLLPVLSHYNGPLSCN